MYQAYIKPWPSIPSYVETFTWPNQKNGFLIAVNGAIDGDIFKGDFALDGFDQPLIWNKFQNCKLSKVSPSYDKKFFAALCENSRLEVGNLADFSLDTYTVNADFTV